MKKSSKTIGIIATITIMLVLAYWLGTTQAETITEVQTVTEIREVIPDGYIPLHECIPLQDIACCFINDNGYLCFELKDIKNQLDNKHNRSYADIMDRLEDTTEECRNNLVDMRTVVDFSMNEYGLQLYFEDGSGYYLERR